MNRMKTFYWLVKREFWEHRGSFVWAPIIAGAVFLLLNLMAIVTAEVLKIGPLAHADHVSNGISIGGANLNLILQQLDADQRSQAGSALSVVMYSVAGVLGIVLGITVFFYCLGALYDERRDRSILFWKSLPISDTSTVLSKVVCAIVIAPAITAVVSIVLSAILLLLYVIALAFHGVAAWQVLSLANPFTVTAHLFGAIPLYMLWALPTVGWLLLCSAFARGKPFVWGVVLPVGAYFALNWFGVVTWITNGLGLPAGWFWNSVVNRALFGVFPGGWWSTSGLNLGENATPEKLLSAMDLHNAYSALAAPSMWLGVALGLIMIAAAIHFRRVRDDS
jgi:ABC-2 type transport system permease protein